MRVLVQHHPSREASCKALRASLSPFEPEIVLDPDPDAKRRSPWRTYRACLERLGDDAGVIVQDDAIACPGFMAAADAAIAARPDRLICFFHGGTQKMRVEFAQAADAFVEITGNQWVPTVALYWPHGFAAELLDWLSSRPRYERRSDDAIVGEWARRTRRGALVTVPCLVQHPDVEPSLIGARARAGHNRMRVAASYIGDDAETWAAGLAIGRESLMLRE